MKTNFKNATKAFEYLYDEIMENWVERNWTKTLFNIWFYIEDTKDRVIKTLWRKFSESYAELEWEWYLSWNRKVDEIWKVAKIWLGMANENWDVNSNYWYQWMRWNQLQAAIDTLKSDDLSRQAVISIYDWKEHEDYDYDTPCTLALHFQIIDNKLCMSVMMRSNDLVFGFGNDQYTFSKLQDIVAEELWIETWWYYHFATNLHIYERHWNMKDKYLQSTEKSINILTN